MSWWPQADLQMLTWFCREQKACPVSDIHQSEISIFIFMDKVVHVAFICFKTSTFFRSLMYCRPLLLLPLYRLTEYLFICAN